MTHRSNHASVLLAIVISLWAAASHLQAQPAAGVLVQAQAADVLSDLMTYAADRTEARVEAMQDFLKEIGKFDAYTEDEVATQHGAPLFFTDVCKGAVEFVRSGGSKYSDPALSSLSEAQLADHLSALQAYNMQEFLYLSRQRQVSNSMARYLESLNEFEHYLNWARARHGLDPGAATQSAPATPEQVAARMQAMIDTARAITWKKAEAMGMSAAEFDRRWQLELARSREMVAQKIEGIRATGMWLTKSQLARTTPPPAQAPLQSPVIWQAGPPAQIAAPSLPPAVQSKYTNAYFSSQGDELWNNWGDPYGDVSNSGHSGRR